MAIALVVVVVVALAALVGLAWVSRGARARAETAEERADQLTTRLGEAVELLEEIETQKRAAEARATGADGRAKSAEQKAGDAERRAGEAEKRISDALRRVDEVTQAKADPGPVEQVWELEKFRAQREWADVVGPGVDLPLAWDGGIAAYVATELAVIRETMGTPSELEVAAEGSAWDLRVAAVGGRVTTELLRRLARSGEEMTVRVGPATVTVTQPVSPDDPPPGLDDLITVCRAAGLVLDVHPDGETWQVVLAVGPSD